MHGQVLDLESHTIVCREGDPSDELFFLQSGKLLICTLSGTQVKAISRISPGEFIGELSFFDGKERSSSVITLEKSQLIKIDREAIAHHLPHWYFQINTSLTKKIRFLNHIVASSSLRKWSDLDSRPLSIEEQRKILKLLSKRDA